MATTPARADGRGGGAHEILHSQRPDLSGSIARSREAWQSGSCIMRSFPASMGLRIIGVSGPGMPLPRGIVGWGWRWAYYQYHYFSITLPLYILIIIMIKFSVNVIIIIIKLSIILILSCILPKL